MSQEFDINEYWEQFDEKTRWIGFAEKPATPTETHQDEFLDTIMWVINNPETILEKPMEETKNTEDSNEDTQNFTQYGKKRKRTETTRQDQLVCQELSMSFEKMKQTVK